MRRTTFLILSFLVVSCEKQVKWELDNNSLNTIVVEGIITDEQKIQEITLKYSANNLNEEPFPATGAIVMVSNEDSVYSFTESPAGSGKYKSVTPFTAILNRNYTLFINHNEKYYSATTYMIQGEEFSPLRYSKNSNDDNYHIDWVANAYDPESYAMYEVLLDWSGVPGYQSFPPESCRAVCLYYTLPTLDVSEVIAPGKQKISFPLGTIITERRYSITASQAYFIRALLLETTWQGGLFDSERYNIPTNLSGGAVGYFSVNAVTSLSLTVE